MIRKIPMLVRKNNANSIAYNANVLCVSTLDFDIAITMADVRVAQMPRNGSVISSPKTRKTKPKNNPQHNA